MDPGWLAGWLLPTAALAVIGHRRVARRAPGSGRAAGRQHDGSQRRMRSTDPPDDLTGFPEATWHAGRRAHRVYRHADPGTGEPRAPLYFASGTGGSHEGRWDLPAPEGSCHHADEAAVRVIEVVAPDPPGGGPPRLVSEVWLRQRRRVEVTARAESGPYADLDAEGASCPAGPATTHPDRSLRGVGPVKTLHDDSDLLRRLREYGIEFLPIPNDVDAG